jgi:hypothetical protein
VDTDVKLLREAHALGLSDTERQAFETIFRLHAEKVAGRFHPGIFKRNADGTYVDLAMQAGWWAWSARAGVSYAAKLGMLEA